MASPATEPAAEPAAELWPSSPSAQHGATHGAQHGAQHGSPRIGDSPRAGGSPVAADSAEAVDLPRPSTRPSTGSPRPSSPFDDDDERAQLIGAERRRLDSYIAVAPPLELTEPSDRAVLSRFGSDVLSDSDGGIVMPRSRASSELSEESLRVAELRRVSELRRSFRPPDEEVSAPAAAARAEADGQVDGLFGIEWLKWPNAPGREGAPGAEKK